MTTSSRLPCLAWLAGIIAGLLVAASCMAADAHGKAPAISTDIVDKLLAEREALFDARGIDLDQFSKDIVTAVSGTDKLIEQGKNKEALDRLLRLEKYMPLPEVPSAMVQVGAGLLYTKLGKPDLAKQYTDRATAYVALLTDRIGKGDSADDPIRVVLINEISDWMQMRRRKVVRSRTMVGQGHSLTVVTYESATGISPFRDLYVEVDPRTMAQLDKATDRYAVIPLSALREQDKSVIKLAHDKRERFLSDSNFSFPELQDTVITLTQAAGELDQAGKSREALSKLREIERLRPLEEIPTPTLLAMYTDLVGKTGDSYKQTELHNLTFGVLQEIANSGDGKSSATAIHVILVSEEYDWLASKKLYAQEKHVQSDGSARYDVIDVMDSRGERRRVYFDITRMYAKYAQGMSGATSH